MRAAEARNAFKEALESYRQALALVNQLPESPERDVRELDLRQSVVRMLYFTNGYSAPETIDATKRAEALAEKSGNLTLLVHWATSRGQSALFSGDLPAAATLADQALEFALRDGRPTNPAYHIGAMHLLQLMTRRFRGDLAGAEKHFTAGLKFFDDPGFQVLSVGALAAFANASWNAWTLGRADVAREREAQMMAAANQNNPYYVAASANCAADSESI